MPLLLLPAAVFAIILSVAAAQWADGKRRRSPRPTWLGYLIWTAIRTHALLLHRTSHIGRETVDPRPAGPLIIVSNHTGAADPLLIQAACTFEIRWMMMREMNRGVVDWFTRYGRIILVERDGRDMASTREALRHLRGGGVLGIFPDGGHRTASRPVAALPGGRRLPRPAHRCGRHPRLDQRHAER